MTDAENRSTALNALWDSPVPEPRLVMLSIDALQEIRPDMTDEVLARDYDIMRGRDFVAMSHGRIAKGIEV
jgi:hypothetical protein